RGRRGRRRAADDRGRGPDLDLQGGGRAVLGHMQLLPEQQRDPERLARLMIPSSKVGQVRLDNVASIQRGLGPARIERFNRQFQVMVNANNAPDFPLDAAARATQQAIRDTNLPAGYSYKFAGSVKILDE